MGQVDHVWVFCGSNSLFPSGVFIELGEADRWIKEHSLTGTLTAYPLNTGVYEWAINKGYFLPSKSYQKTPVFKQRFTSASMEHYHYENGEKM